MIKQPVGPGKEGRREGGNEEEQEEEGRGRGGGGEGGRGGERGTGAPPQLRAIALRSALTCS